MITAGQPQPVSIEKADALYERYGKPLEATHTGEYIAIAENGEYLIGSSVFALMQEALAKLGPGHFIFKIGERAVGKWV